MVTNYPQQLTATAGVSTANGCRPDMARSRRAMGAAQSAAVRARRTRHGAALRGKRVMMRCTSCGHDTPGWEISGRGRGDVRGRREPPPACLVAASGFEEDAPEKTFRRRLSATRRLV